jgi:ankyrin repeat protein
MDPEENDSVSHLRTNTPSYLTHGYIFTTNNETGFVNTQRGGAGDYERMLNELLITTDPYPRMPRYHADYLLHGRPKRKYRARLDEQCERAAHRWVGYMRKGNIQMIKDEFRQWSDRMLLSDPFKEADVPKRTVTLLHLAAESGNLEAIEYLCKQGALSDLETGTSAVETPLIWAIQNNQVEAVKLLIHHGDRVESWTEMGMPAIWLAVSKGLHEIAGILLSNGANKNESYKGTPLVIKAAESHTKSGLDMLLILLRYGANPNCRGISSKESLLHTATRDEDCGLMYVLIGAHADMSSLDDDGKASIHYAAETACKLSGNYEPIQTLVKYGADVDVKTTTGDTALHIAVLNGDRKLSQLLLHAGANMFIRNKDGRTPLQSASNYLATTRKVDQGMFRRISGVIVYIQAVMERNNTVNGHAYS